MANGTIRWRTGQLDLGNYFVERQLVKFMSCYHVGSKNESVNGFFCGTKWMKLINYFQDFKNHEIDFCNFKEISNFSHLSEILEL